MRGFLTAVASSVIPTPPLYVRVRERPLAAGDEVEQRLVHGRVDGRRLVLREPLPPRRACPLRRVQPALLQPLLVAVVIGGRRPVERGLEVPERVRVAHEVVAGTVRGEGVHR